MAIHALYWTTKSIDFLDGTNKAVDEPRRNPGLLYF